MWLNQLFLVVLLLLASCSGLQPVPVIDLNGLWTAQNSNGSIQVPSNVPGGIFTDLMRAGLIGDPYFRDNDVKLKWIGNESWTFTRKFQVSDDILQKERVLLMCHGLDTVSQVYINDIKVGNTDNMFVRYAFDVKLALKSGENTISVAFQSAVKVAEERHTEQLKKYVIPPTCPPPVQNGDCHINYLRKIQSSLSWDWGPSFATQGIWRNISIEAFDSAVLRDVTVTPRLYAAANSVSYSWEIWTRIYLDRAPSNRAVSGHLKVTVAGQTLADLNQTLPVGQGETGLQFRLPLPQNFNPELWWPAGYGEQPLYDLTVTFQDSSSGEVTSKHMKIGFRTVDLVQNSIANSTGLSFYFRVNGVAIFAKGSNWIPADSFPERVTDDYIRRLLTSTRDANMNMLRVWGGGMYEKDSFYNIADELGILIWQDLMFAVALYPVNQAFLDSVTTEVQQQVRRLQHHPSIVVWAGNNENEAAIVQAWWPAILQRGEQYRKDYVQLYITTLMPVVVAEDPDRPFLSSSPSNGLSTQRQVHYYNYGNDGWDWRIYPRPRFASEYGFQSYPSLKTLKNVTLPSDWSYPRSPQISHRQHHMFGEFEMMLSIRRHMLLPKAGQEQSLKDFIYLSQITQAMSIKTESEHYLRSRSSISADGKGMTMGALYWQLNDIWQAPTWASIEYGGKWKMLHYFARNFFSPVLVSPYLDKDQDTVHVYVVSDLLTPQVQLLLQVQVFKWDSLTPTCVVQVRNYTQPAQSALQVYSSPLAGDQGLLTRGSCQSNKECFLAFQLFDQNGHLLSSNFMVLSAFNEAVGLTKANIQVVGVAQSSSDSFVLTLRTSGVAPFVWLDTTDDLEGEFSDNGFLLYQSEQQINFYPRTQTTAQKVLASLEVKSLLDVIV